VSDSIVLANNQNIDVSDSIVLANNQNIDVSDSIVLANKQNIDVSDSIVLANNQNIDVSDSIVLANNKNIDVSDSIALANNQNIDVSDSIVLVNNQNIDVSDSIVLANNQNIDVAGTALVTMYIFGSDHKIFCYIMKMSFHPVILGTEYLIQNKVVLDFSKLTITSKTSNISCVKRTTIPPNSEVMLWDKLPSGIMYGQQGTCANSKYMLSKGLLASKSVVTVSKSRTAPVKILNPSNDAITIHKRKAIANYMPITSCTQIQPVIQ
jgi:hypothetical protein